MTSAHETLDRVNGASRVGDALVTGRGSDERFAFVVECDHTGCGAVAFLVCDDSRFVAVHDSHDRVRRTEINSNNLFALCHRWPPLN